MAESHPGEVMLQYYADGELSAAAAADVRAHLERCAECRTEVEALEEVWADCAAYRNDLLPGEFTPAPMPWADLVSRMVELDRARGRGRARAWQWVPGSARAWAVAAACLVVAVALFFRLRTTPSVEAAALLRRAAAAEKFETNARQIEVRTRAASFMRAADRTGANAVKSLQARFEAAHYNWDNPLSARSFSAWREQLPQKHDRVTRERNVFRIRTDTNTGDLMAASLAVNVADLRPVEGRFDFRDHDWVEISDAGERSVPETGRASAITSERQHRAETPVDAHSDRTLSTSPATAGDELRVFVALHTLRADLGDPIDITRQGGLVRVSAAGIPAVRQSEIRAALSVLPNVSLDFNEPVAVVRKPQEQPAGDVSGHENLSQIQTQLAERIGGRAQLEQTGAQVLEISEGMMAYAYALRRLAEHFPLATESELNSDERRTLDELRSDHAVRLRDAAVRIGNVLEPVLPRQSALAFDAGKTWQQATEPLFQAATRVDRLSATLFGDTSDATASPRLPADLSSTLAELVERATAYTQIKDTRSAK
ncbi:MAG: zf-HC2 domain-containing protein [Acidobacteriaceae bacterium]|nr:zf-HC2 domain-containing protein [Acidobacteriaceae bacterium]